MEKGTFFVDNILDREKTCHLDIMLDLRTKPCPNQSETGFCKLYNDSKKQEDNGQVRISTIIKHDCFYYHNDSEKRRNPIFEFKKELYRPALCKHWSENKGKCPYGISCKYCHGYQELLFHPSIYKTKICKYKEKNFEKCPSGKYCCYAHGKADLREPSTVFSDNKKKKQNKSLPPQPQAGRNELYYPQMYMNSISQEYNFVPQGPQMQQNYLNSHPIYFPKSPQYNNRLSFGDENIIHSCYSSNINTPASPFTPQILTPVSPYGARITSPGAQYNSIYAVTNYGGYQQKIIYDSRQMADNDIIKSNTSQTMDVLTNKISNISFSKR